VKNQTITLLAALVCFITCQLSFAQSHAQLFVVEKDGKSGFIDQTGKVVIPFQFEKASSFHEGLALVIVNGKKFFIDTTGRVLFEAKYDVIREFSEGVCAVNIGEKRIPNIGLISDPGKWGYIDKTGKLVIPMKFTHAEDFSEGLAAIKDGDNGAFIDHDAKKIFETPLDVTLGFREGIVGVLYHGMLAYFDKAGKKISPPLGYGPKNHSFSEGLVPVEIKGKTGFMDRTGKIVIEPQFEDAEDFSEGLAPVKVRSEETTWCPRDAAGSRKGFTMKWGYIDKSGKVVIPAEFESADPFSEGLAAINQCDEGFFIDQTGKKIVLGKFSQVSPFGAGLSRINVGVDRDRRWGFIDKTGKMIWGPVKGW
jgi:WG repeat protein